MRISTAFYYSSTSTALQTQRADLFQTQEQLDTGRRIVTPADDPLGAAYVLQTSQALAISQNNSNNIKIATNKISQENTYLDAINGVLAQVKNIVTGAGGTPSTQERTDAANYLQQQYQNLLAYANSTDANGNYVFAGSKGSTLPFQQTTGASNYQGDNVQQNIAINSQQTIPVSDSGQTVFGVGTANDPFAVISTFITDLQNPALTGAAYQTAVDTAVSSINGAISNVVSVQSQVAGRSQQLTAAATTETQFTLQFQNEIDRVQSADTQKIAVELQLQQTTLQASQQAFVSASKLSLFNFL